MACGGVLARLYTGGTGVNLETEGGIHLKEEAILSGTRRDIEPAFIRPLSWLPKGIFICLSLGLRFAK